MRAATVLPFNSRPNGPNHRVWRRRLFAAVLLAVALGGSFAAESAVAAPGHVLSAAVGSLESTSTSPTPSPEATPTVVFATNRSWGLRLNLPASPTDLIAVGYHQADRSKRTLKMTPVSACLKIYSPARARRLVNAMPGIKMFQQALRGRGTSNFSSADCAVKPNSVILAPVSGTVTSVKNYRLYGVYKDVRVEILPDNASRKLRVVVLHVQNPKVLVGQRVSGGVTPLATVRHFRFKSAVNRYLSAKYADHAHVQINRSK